MQLLTYFFFYVKSPKLFFYIKTKKKILRLKKEKLLGFKIVTGQEDYEASLAPSSFFDWGD